MKIYVNGEHLDCLESRTVREFLCSLGLAPEDVLIVLNSEAISGSGLDTEFAEDDRLEILRFADS